MGYELLRIFYSLWFLGALIFFFNALSALLFTKRARGKRLKMLAASPIFCALWPLAICSPAGRKILFCKLNQL